MPAFGRRGDGPRTDAEREAARLERERRRAEREGRPLPDGAADDERAEAADADPPGPPLAWDGPGDVGEPRVSRTRDAAPEPEFSADDEAADDRHVHWDDEFEPEPAPRADGAAADDPRVDWDDDAEPEPAPRADGEAAEDPRVRWAEDGEPEPRADAEPDPAVGDGDRVAEPGLRGPSERDGADEPQRSYEPARAGTPPAWTEPSGDGSAHPRARAWQQRPGPTAEPPLPSPWRARDRDPDGAAASGDDDERAARAGGANGESAGSFGDRAAPGGGANGDARGGEPAGGADGRDADGAEATGEAGAGAGDRGGAADGDAVDDPQATQPFDAVAASPPPRRTVSLPRPQTDTGEWDAPIGTRRVSRGNRPYEAQPGAPGYPPYRQLVTKPRRRWLRRLVAILALALAIGAAACAFLLFQPVHGHGHGRVAVRVPPGATARQIGDMLADRGVVRSGLLFSLRARLSGQRSELRAGRYVLKEGMPYSAALTALTTPPKAVPVINVTVPEGPSRRETAAQIRESGIEGSYLAASRRSSKLDPRDYGAPRSARTLEGFLFPSTYQLRRSQATARRLVSRQLDAFKDAFAKVDMRTARRRNLSRYDVLIIASMIEREALVPRDRRLISAVIYNRLRQDIPLGIDATLRYGLNQWSRPLRVSELESNSAFNTRRRRGLPPTPIGNPGLQAMRAAANPAKVDYIFYVVKPCGRGAHAFSSTDAQFERDVARYNRARERRGGKDPSRC